MEEDFDMMGNDGFFQENRSRRNDSIGNNSGGCRSQRDEDFDIMDDAYERKVEHKRQQEKRDHEEGQVVQIGPMNNPASSLKTNKQPQISLYDIESHLSSKDVSVLNLKKTFETIIQYLNAFGLEQVNKFIRLVMELPAFDETFDKEQGKGEMMDIQRNMMDDIESDISAKSQGEYKLPARGIQTLFQVVSFLSDLVDKFCDLQNSHLIPLLRQILNTQSHFYKLPLKPQQLIQQNSQFVQNSNNEERYQRLQEDIQNSYIALFQFSDEVTSLKEIFYYFFASRCVNNCFGKDTKDRKLSTKMKIHSIRILSQLALASPQLYMKFQFNKQEANYFVVNETEILKMQKQQIQDYSNTVFDFAHKSPQKIDDLLSFLIQVLVNQENSIEKKSLSLKIIDKLILNTKIYPETVQTISQILEKHQIIHYYLKDQTHSQLLRKLPPIVKFSYELEKIDVDFVKKFIKDAINGHQEFFKVVQSLLQYVKLNHLQQIFHFIKHLTKNQSELLNTHTVGLLQSIVSNINLSPNRKKKKNSVKKQKNYINQHHSNEHQLNHFEEISIEEFPLVYELFGFLFKLVQEPKYQSLYMQVLFKHISLQILLLLPVLEQQLTNRLSKPKNYQSYIISLLDYCLKIDMDSAFLEQYDKKKITQEKQESMKYQFINNLVVNCNLYDSIIVMLCKKRFDKNITEKCLNIFVLATKSYKPLEKGHIELLWKILGLHSTNQFEKEQFFQFIKQILKNSVNLSEQSVKHIYFEIILKLHFDWFTPKIYDCFEMLFMRLNEDGKLLTYENQNNVNQNPSYHLNKTELVGIEKFYYLYFWAEPKVSKKVKDFLFKLYSYKSSPQIKQKLSYELIQAILRYMKRNPESEDHILHAQINSDYELHITKAFEFFSKFLDGSLRLNGEDNSSEQNVITVTIHNVTRGALPPLKKSIEVNRNILLKEFKDLIRKQINPQISDIELINKGKPLRVEKMSLKQLKIENKNTILVQNLDIPVPRKQTEQKKLKQCKQTLQSIFGQQFPTDLLDYIAQKYVGEQLQKICESIMDDEKMREIQNELKCKKLQKMQEEKEIIPKKKYSSDSELLSFGQILSKEIQTLLALIPDRTTESKKSLIEKQWSVIKKIPANLEIAKRISSALQQQNVDFGKIFEFNKTDSLNLQAYTWHLLNKITFRKTDEFKKKIATEKNLEHCIVKTLQDLIQNQVYNNELYQLLIQIHQTMIQGLSKTDIDSKNSVFSLFSIGSRSKNNDIQRSQSTGGILKRVNEILGQCREISNSLSLVIFKKSFEVYKRLIHLLNESVIDQNVASKLLSFLFFNLIEHQNPQFSIQTSFYGNQLYSLISHYKQTFLNFHLSILVVNKNKNIQNQNNSNEKDDFLKEYEELRNFILVNSQNQIDSKKVNEWLYFLLIGYIELIQLDGIKQLKSQQSESKDKMIFNSGLLEFMRLLTQRFTTLEMNVLRGLLALINKLSQIVLTSQKDYRSSNLFIRRNADQISMFIDFFTGSFLFDLKGVPILTEKNIKQQYYQILLTFASANNQLLFKITQKIVQFDIQKRNHDNDNIDFRKNEFVGIQNLGCTCYINSLIQQLYHTRLPYKLLALPKEQGLYELNHTFMQLYMSTKNAINIRPMIQQVKFYGQQIIPTIQQDVEQFLMSLLDFIESCNGRSIVDSIFGGSYSEELTYFSQQEQAKILKKHKEEHFYNITLDIKGKRTLSEALIYFFRSQTLDDKIYCEELDEKTLVVKRSFIKHFPKMMIFTLKRFEFDVENMVRNKVNDYLEFPLELDLTEFSLDKFLSEEQEKERILLQKTQQRGQNTCEQKQRNQESGSHCYRLSGILIHSGSAQTGHYYSYIQRERKWYQFNDRTVTEINLAEKIKGECFGGGDSKSRNAYMLFYQKVERINKNKQQSVQKMEIQNENENEIENEESSQMEEELDMTIPLQDGEEREGHHGIFLSQIPDNNFFKQLVRDENSHFIKQRLTYDPEYRKFIQSLINKIREAKQQNKYETAEDRNYEYLLSDNLTKLEKIDQIVNPKTQQPVVYFASEQMLEEVEMVEMKSNDDKPLDQNQFVDQLLSGNQKSYNNDFI